MPFSQSLKSLLTSPKLLVSTSSNSEIVLMKINVLVKMFSEILSRTKLIFLRHTTYVVENNYVKEVSLEYSVI